MTTQSPNASWKSIVIWHNGISVSLRLTKRRPTYLRVCGRETAEAVAEAQARHWRGRSPDLEGSLLLRCSGLSLMIHARHLQESWLHCQCCFNMCFKAYFSHLFHLHRQHPYLPTDESPMHSFPTTGRSCNISFFNQTSPLMRRQLCISCEQLCSCDTWSCSSPVTHGQRDGSS